MIVLGVEIFKAGEEKIHKIFLDPTGRHLIISLVSTENLYLSRNSKKAKPIGRLKVLNIKILSLGQKHLANSTDLTRRL